MLAWEKNSKNLKMSAGLGADGSLVEWFCIKGVNLYISLCFALAAQSNRLSIFEKS